MIVDMPPGAHEAFETMNLKLRRASTGLRSPYTGARQVLVHPFALWYFEGRLVELDQPKAAPWRGFLASLEGQGNAFRLRVPGAAPSSGYSGPNGSVFGAGQTGGQLQASGFTPGAVVLKSGDYVTVNDELKLVTQDCVANGSGIVLFKFQPPLRKSPPNASVVNVLEPTVLLNAADDDVAEWAVKHPVQHTFSLTAVEAFDIGD